MRKETCPNESHELTRTNCHHRHLYLRHHADKVSALPHLSSKKPTPKTVQYLGKALPCAVFGLLVVYCLKHVSVFSGAHGIPEFIAIAVTAALHLWKKQMLLSIAAGTVVYMLLLQLVF